MNHQAAALSPARSAATQAIDSHKSLAWWGSAALMLAAALLFGFYLVTQQAVARAHMHWERAPVERTAMLDACAASPADLLMRDCLRLR